VVPTSAALDAVSADITAFAEGTPAKQLKIENYSSPQWQYFLSHMPDTLTTEQLAALDDAYGFSKTHNSEILFAWLQLAIKHHYQPAMPALHDFLVSQGRRKFVVPLFKSLMAQEGWGVEMAKKIYAEARPGYHDITRHTVDDIVK